MYSDKYISTLRSNTRPDYITLLKNKDYKRVCANLDFYPDAYAESCIRDCGVEYIGSWCNSLCRYCELWCEKNFYNGPLKYAGNALPDSNVTSNLYSIVSRYRNVKLHYTQSLWYDNINKLGVLHYNYLYSISKINIHNYLWKKKIIIIPLCVHIAKLGAHLIMCIVDPNKKQVIFFDSSDMMNKTCFIKILDILLIPQEIYKWDIVNITKYYAPQLYELNDKILSYVHYDGYCATWGVWFIENYLKMRSRHSNIKIIYKKMVDTLIKTSKIKTDLCIYISPTLFAYMYARRLEKNKFSMAYKAIHDDVFTTDEYWNKIKKQLIIPDKRCFIYYHFGLEYIKCYTTHIRIFENKREIHTDKTYIQKLELVKKF